MSDEDNVLTIEEVNDAVQVLRKHSMPGPITEEDIRDMAHRREDPELFDILKAQEEA